MAHPVDIHVGRRIRYRRWMVGKTQQELAEAVGIRFQQIQKYETGANRVSASRLFDIATVLDAPVAFFFDEMDSDTAPAPASSDAAAEAEPAAARLPEPGLLTDKEALDFLRHYYRLSEEPRKRLYELTRSLAEVA